MCWYVRSHLTHVNMAIHQHSKHDSKIKSEAKNNKNRGDSLAACKEEKGTNKQIAHRLLVSNANARQIEDFLDAKAAVMSGKENPGQKKLHEFPAKLSAKKLKKKSEVCAAHIVGLANTKQK